MDSHSSGFDLDPNAGLTNPQRGAYRTEVPPTTPSRARRALPVALDGLSVGSPAGMIPCTGSRILLRNGVLYIEGGELSNIGRLVEIGRQHAEGRTGGGPPCSWCGERELMHLENSDVWQCRRCHAGSNDIQNGVFVASLVLGGHLLSRLTSLLTWRQGLSFIPKLCGPRA